MLLDYFAEVGDAIEFLMALGSMIGLLGIIFGLIGMMVLGKLSRRSMIPLLVISVLLVAVCGLYTGIKYFRIHV